jgi:hypothetical protein
LITFNNQVLVYSTLKYLEYGVTALLTLLLASRIPANEYGSSAFYFVLISYLQFASLGTNQVLTKWYSIYLDQNKRDETINICFWTTIIVGFLVLFSLSVTFNIMFIYTGLIATGKLLFESIINILRVQQRLKLINFLTGSYTLLFFFLVYFKGDSIKTYFQIWALVYILILIPSYLLLGIKKVSLKLYLKSFNQIILFYKDGLLMLLINFVTLFFTTIDRYFLKIYEVEKSLIGSVQLADTVSTGATLLISSALFILLPKFYELVKKQVHTISYWYKRSLFLACCFSIIVISGIQIFWPIATDYIGMYPYFKIHFILQFIAKVLLGILTIPFAYSVVNSNESYYFKIFLLWSIILLGFYAIISHFFFSILFITIYLNIGLVIFSLCMNIHFFYVYINRYK